MDLTISAPDHTTVSRRAVTLPVIQLASVPIGPLHVLIDSTGLQVYGAGQWLEAKHGAKSPRKWRKLALEPITKRGQAGCLRQLVQPRSPSAGLPGNALAPVL